MKNFLLIALIVASFFAVYQPQSVEAESATITLLNPPANNEVYLSVGETFTPEFYIDSDVEFNWAAAGPDYYYPGKRYVTGDNRDRIQHTTSGTLSLTFTAVGSTSELEGGYAPVSVVVGVRYKGGVVVSEVFDFAVYVQ